MNKLTSNKKPVNHNNVLDFISEMPHIKVRRPDGTFSIMLCARKYSPIVVMILKRIHNKF